MLKGLSKEVQIGLLEQRIKMLITRGETMNQYHINALKREIKRLQSV